MARQGLEDLIAHYSDALPYAIVPNGNGSTNPGTPYGNNPSGSPLGPVNQGGNGAPGSFRVSSWTSYLSTAYGAGVSPAYPGSVTQLFPFNFLSTTSGNQGQNTGVTNAYGNIRGGLGGNGGRGGDDGRGAVGGQGGCGGGNGGLAGRVATGVVVSVRADSFDIKADDGSVYTIRVAPCTQLNANRADYVMETGHQAVVKGNEAQGGKNIWDASLITCLQ